MWVVESKYNSDQMPSLSVVHIDTIVCSVHLIPAFQQHEVPHGLHHWQSLNVYDMYYVNKYADLNIHELLHQRQSSIADTTQDFEEDGESNASMSTTV